MKRVVRLQIQYEVEIEDTLATELTLEVIPAIIKVFETPVKDKSFVGTGKVEKVSIGWE